MRPTSNWPRIPTSAHPARHLPLLPLGPLAPHHCYPLPLCRQPEGAPRSTWENPPIKAFHLTHARVRMRRAAAMDQWDQWDQWDKGAQWIERAATPVEVLQG